MKKKLDDIRNSKEYYAVMKIIEDEVFSKVREEMDKNPEVARLAKIIEQNNSCIFNRTYEREFQIDETFFDGHEDITSYRYSEELYQEYRDFLKNYRSKLGVLEAKKHKLETKFHFFKNRRLEKVKQDIEKLRLKHEKYLKIYEREKLYQATWEKDGKFVNINDEHFQKMVKISLPLFKKYFSECLNNHPELMVYDFDRVHFNNLYRMYPAKNGKEPQLERGSISYRLSEIIKEEQNERELQAVKIDTKQKERKTTKSNTKTKSNPIVL
ncbi:MAG: hypothetical protein IJ008_00435 [Clostridia bacterium]|nr:hypothetical protein [Clostridia bacterium]